LAGNRTFLLGLDNTSLCTIPVCGQSWKMNRDSREHAHWPDASKLLFYTLLIPSAFIDVADSAILTGTFRPEPRVQLASALVRNCSRSWGSLIREEKLVYKIIYISFRYSTKNPRKLLKNMVGLPRFELGTSCTPSKRASQAAPQPELPSIQRRQSNKSSAACISLCACPSPLRAAASTPALYMARASSVRPIRSSVCPPWKYPAG
jgi:hypothetical protein